MQHLVFCKFEVLKGKIGCRDITEYYERKSFFQVACNYHDDPEIMHMARSIYNDMTNSSTYYVDETLLENALSK